MVFLDTNVLVYAVDFRDERKQKIAQAIVEDALSGLGGYSLAVQTLSEFANVALSKLKKPPEDVAALLLTYMDIPTIEPNGTTVLNGLEIKRTYGIQFYDAMMIASAQKANAEIIYSEDLNNGQLYGNVRAVNPFS